MHRSSIEEIWRVGGIERRLSADLMVLKVGSKEELYVQMFAYQLNLRLKAIQNMERAPL